jgi:hypothetical protein
VALSGPQAGTLFPSHEMNPGSTVVELKDVSLLPDETEGVRSGAADKKAQPTEIELRGADLFFVTSDGRRVNLQTGEIKNDDSSRPAEIYTRWSLVRVEGGVAPSSMSTSLDRASTLIADDGTVCRDPSCVGSQRELAISHN